MKRTAPHLGAHDLGYHFVRWGVQHGEGYLSHSVAMEHSRLDMRRTFVSEKRDAKHRVGYGE